MAILKTERVTRHFGGLSALSGVSIEFRQNEILGIIGPKRGGEDNFHQRHRRHLPSHGGKNLF